MMELPPLEYTFDNIVLGWREEAVSFARKHGFNGTPVIVREDGAVVHGYRPREFLESWLEGSAS